MKYPSQILVEFSAPRVNHLPRQRGPGRAGLNMNTDIFLRANGSRGGCLAQRHRKTTRPAPAPGSCGRGVPMDR